MSINTDHKAKARREAAFRVLSLLEGRPVTDDDIARKENGRPYFKQGVGSDFNISHSGDIVAVSHVRGEGVRTGCDIQLVNERVNTFRIAEQFFHSAEKEYILSQKEKGNDSAFFEIWVLKESYIKLHGLSVFDMTATPDFVNKDGSLNPALENTSFFLYNLNDVDERRYILAAAIKGETIPPNIRWFSKEKDLHIERKRSLQYLGRNGN